MLGTDKIQRIVDHELLEVVRSLPCICCRKTGGTHPHHVTSRGAGGHDVATNLMPLCVEHHALWHQRGPGYMIERFPAVLQWLRVAGRNDVINRASRS